ncbi:MAG: segregation/condensation protein A [Hyphomicrobiales bacterium]|nr:segregation/condensation protein A [Hyphomicrobiales bacterium]
MTEISEDENSEGLRTENQVDLWESEKPEVNSSDTGSGDQLLVVDVDGFEGPLDLLLELSRRQKVDLAKISILDLANQYLVFIEQVQKLRIELAADYLVMAAWLAYLKSKLLIPVTEEEGLSGQEMAAQLAHRLKRLEAMRNMGNRLVNRNRLGRDFFARGIPEPMVIETNKKYTANLYDLLTAYAAQRQRQSVSSVTIAKRQVWSLQEAREILIKLVGQLKDWTPLDAFLLQYIPNPQMRSSLVASSFAASLELAREGMVELRQEKAFATLFVKNTASTDVLNPNDAEVVKAV